MLARISVAAYLAIFVILGPGLATAQRTPFSFVQRPDVGREINVSPGQLDRVRELQPYCDTQCRLQMLQLTDLVDEQTQNDFHLLDPAEQQTTIQNVQRDLRETIEMTVLEASVLTEEQMARFRQLWTQFLGLDALTTGESSRLLDMSPAQINQIQEIQGFGSDLINDCLGNPNFTGEQQGQAIQIIQNAVIDQSVNILNGAQFDIFLNLCGEPCEFDLPDESGPTFENDAFFENHADTNETTSPEFEVDNVGTAETETSDPNPTSGQTNNARLGNRGTTTRTQQQRRQPPSRDSQNPDRSGTRTGNRG